jgi:hypothetical protein
LDQEKQARDGVQRDGKPPPAANAEERSDCSDSAPSICINILQRSHHMAPHIPEKEGR